MPNPFNELNNILTAKNTKLSYQIINQPIYYYLLLLLLFIINYYYFYFIEY